MPEADNYFLRDQQGMWPQLGEVNAEKQKAQPGWLG
jgi:hypothetical protein